MNNFIVGLTDVSPDTTPVSLWNYDLCGQYPGAVPDSVTVYLQCDQSAPPRRYLVVQSPASVYLSFCEIEVYLRRKLMLLASCYAPNCRDVQKRDIAWPRLVKRLPDIAQGSVATRLRRGGMFNDDFILN